MDCKSCRAYAKGGAVCDEHSSMSDRAMAKRHYAKGGMVEEDEMEDGKPEAHDVMDDFDPVDDFRSDGDHEEEDTSLSGQIMRKRRMKK